MADDGFHPNLQQSDRVARNRVHHVKSSDIDPDTLIEAVLGPIYMRMLVTREPLTEEFVQQIIDLSLNGARRE